MNIVEIKNAVLEGKFDESFSMLYSDTSFAKERYSAACDSFKELFCEAENIRLFSAPGRTEIGGNHTDHQHGCVIAGSVNLDVIAVVALNGEDKIRIKSEGFPMDTIELSDLEKSEKEYGRASALIRGVCKKFADMGCELKGFNAYTTSNVLKGSGLSSSAAFEVLLGNILNGLFNENRTDAIEIAKIGQFAEREYFGKPCGLLDQMASSLGGFTYADFSNPADPITQSITLDIKKFGYTLCVVDTGGNHSDLTDDYAAITVECREISEKMGVSFLREVDTDAFYGRIAELREACGDRAVLRAIHFFDEQGRVEGQKKALAEGDFDTFLKLVNESGQSSYDYLQNLYSPSSPKEQGLSLAIALTKKFLNGKGACRVHGGGFAGTIQCYIPTEKFDEYKAMIEAAYGEGACQEITVRPVGGYEIK